MSTRNRISAVAALLVSTLAFGPAGIAIAGQSGEHRTKTYEVHFDKSDPDGDFVFEGTTTGAAQGTVRSYPTSVTPQGDILLVTFVWEISAGERSFTAVTDGELNTVTGEVILRGEVTDGWLEGAKVREQGQLVDASTSRYVGTIKLKVHKHK